MKNIDGHPSETQVRLSVVPAGGKTPVVYETIRRIAPPASLDILVPKNETKDWIEAHKGQISFRKAKKSGSIVMNPYKRGTQKDEYFLVRVPRASYLYETWCYHSVNCAKGIINRDDVTVDLACNWFEQGYQDYWENQKQVPYFKADLSDLEKKVERVKTSLLANLNTSYDFLTEIAEFKDSVQLVNQLILAARNPLRTFKQTKDDLYKAFRRGELKTYSHLMKEVGSAWLKVRYGIMPIVYSIQDILKTLKLRNVIYHTERVGESVNMMDFTPSDPLLPYSFYIKDVVSGVSHIRAVGKDRYAEGTEVQLSDLIGFNPFVTAWEKVPYSFVVDWFLNIGDWINAVTSSVASFSSERKCCWSLKTDYRIDTYLYWDLNDSQVFTGENPMNATLPLVACGTTLVPKSNVKRGSPTSGQALLRRSTVLTYEREIFDHTDVKLSVSAQLNAKRIVDAIFLSTNHARKHLRFLR